MCRAPKDFLVGPVHCSQESVQPALAPVLPIEDRGVARVWSDTVADPDHLVASIIHAGPHAGTDPGEQRCAESGPFLRCNNLDFLPIHIRLNPPPERLPRSSATEPNSSNRDPQLFEKSQAVAQAERHTVEDGANHMRAAVAGRQSRQPRSRLWVGVRSAPSHEVGCSQHSVGVRRCLRRLFAELIVTFAAFVTESVAVPRQ